MKIMIMKCDFQYKFYFPDTLMFINKLLRNKDPARLAVSATEKPFGSFSAEMVYEAGWVDEAVASLLGVAALLESDTAHCFRTVVARDEGESGES